jgi:hypothetical protein
VADSSHAQDLAEVVPVLGGRPTAGGDSAQSTAGCITITQPSVVSLDIDFREPIDLGR